MAYAPSLSGPWTQLPQPVLSANTNETAVDSSSVSNPAPAFYRDGSGRMLLAYKGLGKRDPDRPRKPCSDGSGEACISVASAPHWTGPYEHSTADAGFILRGEDMTLWQNSDGFWHMIYELYDANRSTSGRHAFSATGLDRWGMTPMLTSISTTVNLDGRQNVRLAKRERYQLLLDNANNPKMLFNGAALDGLDFNIAAQIERQDRTDTRRSANAVADTAGGLGILNATRDCPGVINTGDVDVTHALQACIVSAYAANLALYLPHGRYLVSDTLAANQSGGGAGPVNVVVCRFRPNTLIGAAITSSPGPRPTIVLAKGSAGFHNASSPKNVMKISNPSSEDINMNQAIRGIDFEIEGGNPGAVALFFHGAQGGVVQDVSVRLAPDALAGFAGGGGAGTSHINVEVYGGVHGFLFLESEPAPCLANARFHNQSGEAIVASHEQTLVAVGLYIVAGPRTAATDGDPVIRTYWSGHQNNAQLSLVDSVIDCAGIEQLNAIDASTSLYINNVWVRDCSTVSTMPGTQHPGPVQTLKANWTVVNELARGVDCPASMKDLGKYNVTMNVVYTDGKRVAGGTITNISASATAPPAKVLQQHKLWVESKFPSLDSPTTVNAVATCGVAGDGETDDEPQLSACLQKHKDVFLPKGHYRLGRTLTLQPGNRLVGLGQTLSVLMPLTTGLLGGGNSTHPQPLVRTTEGVAATLAFIGLVSWWHLPVFTLEWRSKGGLWRSNYETRVCECLWLSDYSNRTNTCQLAMKLSHPKTLVQGTGSFVNYVSDEDILMTDHVFYRHLLAKNLGSHSNPADRLRFYELNLEHGQSQANMEVNNASHVDIYGVKLEGSTPILWIRDSYEISLFGMGGSGDSFPNCDSSQNGTRRFAGRPLCPLRLRWDYNIPDDFEHYNFSTIRVERTPKYRLVNLINNDRGTEINPSVHPIHNVPLTPAMLSHHPWPPADIPLIIQSMWSPWQGYALPPSMWAVVAEMDGTDDASAIVSGALDRPILWQRGYGTTTNSMND
eukprot:SAG31_NODE_3174_length_4587_cov_7.232843_2_plen_1013_part_00